MVQVHENGSRPPYDVLVVGSGPAGWTAALYAARANLRTLVLTGRQAGGLPGGQLMLTTDVENFPGFPDGIQGPELMDRLRRQAERFGIEAVEADATGVDFGARPFRVVAGDRTYRAQAVILATGASARWLGLPSEARLRGRGVSACAVCDAPFFRDREVAVVGGGDSALEEAIHLTRFARRVTVVHRGGTLRAAPIMRDRARANPKIAWALHREVVEVLGERQVEGVRLRDPRSDAVETLPVQGIFVAIGHRPNTDPFRGQVALDADGYVVAARRTETSVPGVFVAGDVRDRRYRQAVTAAGDGAMAALDAAEFLTGAVPVDWAAAGVDDAAGAAPSAAPRFGADGGVGAGDAGDATGDGASPAAMTEAPDGTTRPAPLAPPTTGAPAANAPALTVYTTSWCPDCRAAKRYLRERGIPYEEIDIEWTPGAAERVEAWSGGYRTVPTFDVGGRIVVGFERGALEAALAATGVAAGDAVLAAV